MAQPQLSKAVLFSDFDNTIVNIDTGEFALEHFGDPNWRRIEEEYVRGNISFEDSLQKEFGSIKVPEELILKELDKVVVIRPYFADLVKYCQNEGVYFVVVSGGLDFCLRHFLDQHGWLKFIEIHAPKAVYTVDGYRLEFPKMLYKESVNFKDDLVTYHKKRGSKVFYIGDGLGDYPAVKAADYPFAIKGSRLAEACRKANIQCKEVVDFRQVAEAVETYDA